MFQNRVVAIILSILFFSFSATAQELESEGREQDHPGEAEKYEAEITKDPALGTVPSERLQAVREYVKRQRALSGDARTAIQWLECGPDNQGGRTRALMFDPNDNTHKKVWAGGVGGGLWYNNDITIATSTWRNVNDFWSNIAISCIAYSPANKQVFYVGTGEGWNNIDNIKGAGIWKTTDGGSTWNQLASTNNDDFSYVQKVAVTASGDVYAGTNTGLWRSTDNGVTWSNVLARATKDIEIGADGTIYVSNYSGGSGVYSSTNGITWTARGLTGYGRIELATAPNDANRLYAMVEQSSVLQNIYTSGDKGVTWIACTKPSWVDQDCNNPTNDMTRRQAWYDLIIAVDPNAPGTLIAGGVDLMKSIDTGRTWKQLTSWWGGCGRPYVHADQHAISYVPGLSSAAIFGNDGGVYYSANINTTTPTFEDRVQGYNVTQFYSCAINPTQGSSNYLAGAQDNGTHKFISQGLGSTDKVTGGDGMLCFIDQSNANIQISSYTRNNYTLTTDNWLTSQTISSSGSNIGSFINPADYDDSSHILYSSYSSTQIQRITGINGNRVTAQFTISGMTNFADCIRVSPYAPTGTSTIFVGSAGKLFKVTNAQGASATTTSIGGASFPGGSISCIEIGATENDLLVTFSNYGVVSVWRTTDGGVTWANKEGNLPDMPIRWAIYNPNNLNEVMLATEVGIWSCDDINVASPNWTVNNNNLANTRVTMLQYRKSDKRMIASTHGRGLFYTNSFSGTSVPNFSATTTKVCLNAPIVFTNTSTGTQDGLLWNFGEGATPATSTSIQPVSVTYSTPGLKTVSLTLNGSGPVLTKTNYVEIGIKPSTAGAITGLGVVCAGQSAVAYSTAAIPNATSYNWVLPSGVSIASGVGTNNITVNFSSQVLASSIVVNGVNAFCTGATSSKAFAVNPLPTNTSTISGSANVCVGKSNIAYNVTAVQNATGYNWSLPSGITITSGNNTNSIVTNFSSIAQSGNIVATPTNACGSGTPSSLFAVNARPLPIVNLTASPQPFCSNDPSLQLTAVFTGETAQNSSTGSISPMLPIPDNINTGASSIINISGSNYIVTNGTVIDVQLDISHTYNRDLAAYLIGPGKCGSMALINRHGGFLQGFKLNLHSSGNYPDVNQINNNLSSPVTGDYLTISGVDVPPATNDNVDSIPNISLAAGNCPINGNWKLFVLDLQGQDIGVVNNWSVSFTNGHSAVFSGPSSTSFSSVSYQSITNGMQASVNVINPVAGNYFVTTTDSYGCVSTPASTIVAIGTSPAVSLSSLSLQTCASASLQTLPLDYSILSGNPDTYSIAWNPSPANNFTAVTEAPLAGNSLPIIIPANTAPNTYTGTVSVKNASGCVTTAGIVSVKVNRTPAAPAISGNVPFCSGDSIKLYASGKSNGMATGLVAPGISGFGTTNCDCPRGYVAVGIQGSTGAWIDQFTLVCQKLNSNGTLSGPTINTTFNGVSVGPTPVGPFVLPANTIMVGANADYYNNSIRSIKGYGQTIANIINNVDNTISPQATTPVQGWYTPMGSLGDSYVPNGSVITGMMAYNTTYASGVRWRYKPIESFFNTYDWSNGITGDSIYAKNPGKYYVTVSTPEGCIAKDSITTAINSLPQPVISGNLDVCLNGFTQGFEAGLPNDWMIKNNSIPSGTTTWFVQSNVNDFAAHSGNAYLAADYGSISGAGTISNWFISPDTILHNGDIFSFWTRTISTVTYPDRLQVRMSTNGASTNVGSVAEDLGDFTTLLLDINPSLTFAGYPTAWKQHAIKISGLTTPVNGRIAFRYYVSDGGTGSNSYKIGIDDIVFSTESTTLDAGPGFTSYQWSNGATTQTTTAGPSEVLSVTVKNGNGCTGTSAVVTTTIKPALTPALSIALSTQPAFLGSPVTFNATPLNGGTAPTYQWKVDGVNVGVNSSTFTSSTLTSGKLVTCAMTTSETCKTVDTALSNSIAMNLLDTYTFTGTGNWNVSANWDNNTVPPASLPRGCTIIINPSSGECLLNTPQTISSGASISVSAGKKFRMLGNLRIQ